MTAEHRILAIDQELPLDWQTAESTTAHQET